MRCIGSYTNGPQNLTRVLVLPLPITYKVEILSSDHWVSLSKSRQGLGLNDGVLLLTLRKAAPLHKVSTYHLIFNLTILMVPFAIRCSLGRLMILDDTLEDNLLCFKWSDQGRLFGSLPQWSYLPLNYFVTPYGWI